MKLAIVYYANGARIPTTIDGTETEIRNYFKIGREFNIGDGPNDLIQKVARVFIKPMQDLTDWAVNNLSNASYSDIIARGGFPSGYTLDDVIHALKFAQNEYNVNGMFTAKLLTNIERINDMSVNQIDERSVVLKDDCLSIQVERDIDGFPNYQEIKIHDIDAFVSKYLLKLHNI